MHYTRDVGYSLDGLGLARGSALGVSGITYGYVEVMCHSLQVSGVNATGVPATVMNF